MSTHAQTTEKKNTQKTTRYKYFDSEDNRPVHPVPNKNFTPHDNTSRSNPDSIPAGDQMCVK